LKKFVLVTRGRTGSTAVIDELGKASHTCTTQELFLNGRFTEESLRQKYKLLLPFDLWKQSGEWRQRVLPTSWQAKHYLTHAAILAQCHGIKAFGWKVLSHHFDERPFLGALLKQQGYRAVYLRRNAVRQVLSGMVAKQRGVYNSMEKVADKCRYHVEIAGFRWLVRWEQECVKNDCAWLVAEGFDFIEVSYEDFCADRRIFYGRIFNFLDLPLEVPPASGFVKMIHDLKLVIENYDEVVDAATEFGVVL
jgi:LPS sulfotransferase NodH